MTLTSSELQRELQLFEFIPGKKAAWATLRRLLPDLESALFFAKAYKMSYSNLSLLVQTLFNHPILKLLGAGDHSTELQDYLVDVVPTDVYEQVAPRLTVENRPAADILPEFWAQAELTIAESIRTVALKLGNVLDALPSKEGVMTFQHLAQHNRQRPTIGDYRATIKHQVVPNNLVIFDVSGSMTSTTVQALVDEVVGLAWSANATLAIVSNSCFTWEPGTYTSAEVLRCAEYGGTQYETLAPLFADGRVWGNVICVADYDSSYGAKDALAKQTGTIGKVFDISLVNRPTFLAECVGQLADEVEPLLIATSRYVLS